MPASKKLTVSNIAWDNSLSDDVVSILKSAGVCAVEVAPSVVWPDWQGATEKAASDYREHFKTEGLSIPSLQAILFARPDLILFGTPEQRKGLLGHIEYVADLAVALGAKILVFGAPKNRLRGALSIAEAQKIAVNFFKQAGAACAKRDVCLCIEPNPTQYACDFVTNSTEGVELVKAVDSPGFGLHLDVAGMHLAGESAYDAIIAARDYLRHVHASEPELRDFSSPVCDHAGAARALQEINYNGWVSIEMRKSEHPLKSVKRACEFVMEQYFDAKPSRL